MDELIEALNIARKYALEYELQYPTGAAHDVLWLSIDADLVTEKDLKRLEELSFTVNSDYAGALCSYKFGAC